MKESELLQSLVAYGIAHELVDARDAHYVTNLLLERLGMKEFDEGARSEAQPLDALLAQLCDGASARGLCGDTVTQRDLFDTALMGILTPPPSEVQRRFWALYESSPRAATDWFYRFCQDNNYIRRDRIAKDQKWVTETQYGAIDITINLSKPEKDPKEIAAAKSAVQSGYPKCQLCPENEGFSGHANHPARQNLRLIPLTIAQQPWAMQYSPYVYYPEHCIVLNQAHEPMVIDRSVFEKLLDFVTLFPHYFVGSNADLPIVGGSILSHEHFQGGNYTFAMERAPIEETIALPDFDGTCGIVAWPMSVLRLRHHDRAQLVAAADRVLTAWRGYSDPSAFVFSHSGETPHNTITPIARMREGCFELDLVLRNNITTQEHPLGVFHPHAQLHNIKKENIGLIEVMGLAVLPSRLKMELALLGEALVRGDDVRADARMEKHADWVSSWRASYPQLSADNVTEILQKEVGETFKTVLEHAGVFKRDAAGKEAFRRFAAAI